MLVGGGDKVSVVPVVYSCGKVSVLSLGSFLSFYSSYKPSRPSLPLSILAHYIREYFNKKRERPEKHIKPQEEEARREQQMKKMRMKVRAKLVVGYWELVPMESGSNNSS